MPRTITFQPSKEIGDFIEGLIHSGCYNNQSEVVREGLRLLQERNAQSKLQQLKSLIDEGEHSGDMAAWDVEEFLKWMKKPPHGKDL